MPWDGYPSTKEYEVSGEHDEELQFLETLQYFVLRNAVAEESSLDILGIAAYTYQSMSDAPVAFGSTQADVPFYRTATICYRRTLVWDIILRCVTKDECEPAQTIGAYDLLDNSAFLVPEASSLIDVVPRHVEEVSDFAFTVYLCLRDTVGAADAIMAGFVSYLLSSVTLGRSPRDEARKLYQELKRPNGAVHWDRVKMVVNNHAPGTNIWYYSDEYHIDEFSVIQKECELTLPCCILHQLFGVHAPSSRSSFEEASCRKRFVWKFEEELSDFIGTTSQFTNSKMTGPRAVHSNIHPAGRVSLRSKNRKKTKEKGEPCKFCGCVKSTSPPPKVVKPRTPRKSAKQKVEMQVCDDDYIRDDDDLSVSVASSSEDKPGPSGLSGPSTSNSQESLIPETLKETYKDVLFAMASKRVVQKSLWEQHEEAKCRFAPNDFEARMED